ADCLIGARRILDAAAMPGQPVFEAVAAEAIASYIAEHNEFRSFTVVLSGDSGFYSGAKKLLPLLKQQNARVTVLPGLSSLSVLCARMGISYEDVKTVSLHGRTGNIAASVRRYPLCFALVGGENGVRELCEALVRAGLGSVRVTVGERLSYPDERISTGIAAKMAEGRYASLSAVLIENPGAKKVCPIGLPDESFQRGKGEDGLIPMTKSEVRAVALSRLAMTRDAICWDIGAGTGSVSVEMALLAEEGRVYAVEKKADAFALLQENIKKFGAFNITAVEGSAPAALEALPAPTHVFIGGSSGRLKDIIGAALEKNPHARIVATAIALETVAELSSCMKEFSFTHKEAVCIQAARSRKAGPYHLMTGANPVYIFTFQKEARAE
ncbi:MAG: precorrin-6Y C5,15-methyltransferase (decarboxylating) subunit CbiT, partial [Firmicutes bacterium]|nr:precorrin-6Y C5,15-methyltransferase (decarboxylating) subunit CbiT [Bacillota bacterium]